MTMKKVKAAEVAKGKWRLSDADRLNLSSIETSKNVTGAMQTIVTAMEANIKILDKIAEHMDSRIEGINQLGKALPPGPATIQPSIDVIVPVDKTKKKFRCTPVRDADGIIAYVDLEQL
jgi:hypothetical protein